MTTEKPLTTIGVAGAFIIDLAVGVYLWKTETPIFDPVVEVVAFAAIVLTVASVLFRVRAERDFDFG